MPTKIVTLTTDFGLRDPYAAEMKAAILCICPTATIIDITHEVEKFNIRMGAYVLSSAAEYFPKGTIHVAVVDPKVGTRRRPLLIRTRKAFFVGPDTGLLTLATQKQGIIEIIEITNRKFMLAKISNTFHGRDLFAPVAAHIAAGVPIKEFGPTTSEVAKPDFARVKNDKSTLLGEILHIDGFGNLITNISDKELRSIHLEKDCSVEIGSRKFIIELHKAYGESQLHQLLAVVGSHANLEIAVNQGNASEVLAAKVGDKIRVGKA